MPATPSPVTHWPGAPPQSTCRPSTAFSIHRRCRNGCWPMRCRFACNCNCTSTSGRLICVASNVSSGTRSAVLLLSGGLDSYTAGAIARAEGFDLYALTIKYGQRHVREIELARAVASALSVVRHIELDVDLSAFGGSSLTSEAPVPKDRRIDATDIPSTYVPARNTVFLALA